MSAAFIASRAAYLVARIAALGGRGAQQIAMRGLPRSRAAAIADAARPGIRDLGYECVRAGQPMPERDRTLLAHRHMALFVCDARDGASLGRWVALLARTSPRAHVIVRLDDQPMGGVTIPSAHGAEDDGRAGVHVWQGVSELLQIVQDAEDDHASLLGAAMWLRRSADASAVAFVSEGASVPIAAAGCTRHDLERGELAEALREPIGRVVVGAGHAAFALPIRYAGVRVGTLVVRGPAADVPGLQQPAHLAAALCGPALRTRLDALALARASQTALADIVGRSPSMVALREAIGRAAATPFPVLIEGESGTGKELVARALHRLSPRRDRRFCAINCAALTDDLMESELFGHARGAFTGAIGPRTGLFEEAHNGTLFLDEVSELSARAQAKLLRALQEREVRRLGENGARPVDVRLVAATNLPLNDAVAGGRFREDLLFRLRVIRLQIAPLRERVEDVPLLAVGFWSKRLEDTGKHAVLAPDAMASLCRHRWPGNVRELQNVLSALAVLAPVRGRISARHVAQALGDSNARPAVAKLGQARATAERQTVAAALARHGGRRTAAARDLGLTRQGLTKAIKRLGIAAPDENIGVA